MTQKIIYAMRSKAHFSYHESTIDALVGEPDVELLLAFDEHWSHYGSPSHVAYENWHARNPNIRSVYYPVRKGLLRKPMMWMRELRSFNNYCTRGDDFEFYRNRWSHYLGLSPKWRERIMQKRYRRYLGSKWLRKALTLAERLTPPDRGITAWLEVERPAAIIASPCNMRYSEEIEIVKAARALDIPAIIPVLSWDNTSTKGLFNVQPNLVLAWHQGHKDECVRYHGVNSKMIAITGAPFFDKWRGAMDQATPREAFCARVGLDPKRPFVLYLGSSANIAPDETWLVREIHQALAASTDPKLQQTQILFRAHPANWKHGLKLLEDGIGVWPREGTLPDSPETFHDFRDSLAHAEAVIGLNTSGMLDAIINNKPIISPVVERYRFTQEKAEHFIRMRSNETLYAVSDVAGVLSRIQALREGKDPQAEHRKKFTATYIWPRGPEHSAGEIITREVLHFVRTGKPMAQGAAANSQAYLTPSEVVDVQALFGRFAENVEKERQSPLYQKYLTTRDKILKLMTSYQMSAYWAEEVAGFDYLFDASPLVVAKLREHCYHITGERAYNYREHHSHKAKPYLARLDDLRALDDGHCFVPESPACGGFGHRSPHGLVNLDTLKFYEVLIGINKAGFLKPFQSRTSERKAMVEIGSGWGGFAYQFHTLFPNTTIFCIDLPPTLLFSATYVQGACPNAKIAILGDMPNDELFRRWQEFDFIFIPANQISKFKPVTLDLAVNMCSFQEMTTAQVTEYVHQLAALGCKHLYSLNRDRSHHNPELSLVSEIMSERYRIKRIDVLPTEYCTVGAKTKAKSAIPLRDNPASYRHLAGTL